MSIEIKQKYYDIVQSKFKNADAFFRELDNIGKRLGFPGAWIADVIYIETGNQSFQPNAKNPSSTATGLIQFMAKTAIGLGTTTARLAVMSNIQQLVYVEKYFKGQMKTFRVVPKDWFDVYLLVFYPAWVGKSDNQLLSSSAYKANSFIDQNKDGVITKGEFRIWANKQLPGGAVESIKKPFLLLV